MDENHLEQQKEIVFTYRHEEQAEPVQPVELRYERPLPERMRQKPDGMLWIRELGLNLDMDLDVDLDSDFNLDDDDDEPWRVAIAPPERQRKGRWSVRLFVGTCLLAALVCLGAGIWYVGQYGWTLPKDWEPEPPGSGQPDSEERYYWDYDTPNEETTIIRYPAGGETRLTLAAQAAQVLEPGDVYGKVNPSVVTVLGEQRKYSSVGTGIILSADGYVLTNHHVIAGCSSCQVWVTGEYGENRSYDAKLVGSDETQDLAVLKVDGKGFPAAEFGVSDDLRVGDPVYAIGNPLGIELRNTFTDGIVSSVNRSVEVDGVSMTLIQTNAALNSGNSGGPLINQYGQVVGVNTIKMMSNYDTIEGLGFAIPSSLAVRWVNELIAYGELLPQPVLGITIDRIPRTLPDGTLAVVVIKEVTPGGSGDRAGLRAGDYLVSFAGQDVISTEQILAIRRELFVGDEVAVRVYRNGRYLDLTMIMAAEP